MVTQSAAAPAIRTPPSAANARAIRWLTAAVILLAAALLGALVFLAAPLVITSEGEAIQTRLVDAWNEGDLDEVRELYADDAFIWLSSSDQPLAIGIDEIVEEVQYASQTGFRVELIGPVSEELNLVWAPGHVTTNYDAGGDEDLNVLVLEDGKIVQHWVIWEER